MQFSTFATIAAVASVASAAANITTATVSKETTTLVTITSCEDHVCHETVSPALVSTATVTVDNVITKFTTWCPLETVVSKASNKTTSAAPTHAPVTSSVVTKSNQSTVTTTVHSTIAVQSVSSTHAVSSFTGAANRALPAVGALVAGAAALLI